jgi:hypothetical protein
VLCDATDDDIPRLAAKLPGQGDEREVLHSPSS